MKKMKLMSIFGSRFEAVKLCPLIRELSLDERFEIQACLTSRRDSVNHVLGVFDITPDFVLDGITSGQSLTALTAKILAEIEPVLAEEKPDMVLVYGDSVTSLAAAMAASHQKIPVGHIGAGIRTYQTHSSEEMNRMLIGRLATLHFAPTALNKANLIRENVLENIFVTGDMLPDTFQTTVTEGYIFQNTTLRKLDYSKKTVLVNLCKQENLGGSLEAVCRAVKRLVDVCGDIQVICQVAKKPAISEPTQKILGRQVRIHLLEPLAVTDLHHLLDKCRLLLTDHAELLEAGLYFKKPVLVPQTESAHPEAVEAGCIKPIGTDEETVFEELQAVVADEAAYQAFLKNDSPYGEGGAAKQIADAISQWYFLNHV